MSQFKTRIELRNPTEKEFEKVHAAMAKQGFIETDKDSSSISFLPPPHMSANTRNQIHVVKELASAAARKTGLAVKVSVTESAEE